MHKSLEAIQQLIAQVVLSEENKTLLLKALTEADKQFAIIEFKLDRTEKVKRTTSILLEETIEELEQKRKAVEDSHKALERSIEELKSTQSQLIQSEKMASLGELTAGIAHEIQNPLNFVNNFSELNVELVEELKGIRGKEEGDREKGIDDRLQGIGNSELEEEIINDIKENSEKINHHGKRAADIVKGMLQHSRSSTGQKEPTDINALCDEYLRLAYHGLRAKDKTFNAEFRTEFDETIGKINVQPQEMGRVVLNLINNAFFAVSERGKAEGGRYKVEGGSGKEEGAPSTSNPTPYTPMVTVKTTKLLNTIEIRVTDNGTGIPQHIKEKIFQPFFTTKPTGQGTGLGLSLAYDIVTKVHGGKLTLESEVGKGTTFIVRIPT
jgi:two-component system, NtrC family, sensor kinase